MGIWSEAHYNYNRINTITEKISKPLNKYLSGVCNIIEPAVIVDFASEYTLGRLEPEETLTIFMSVRNSDNYIDIEKLPARIRFKPVQPIISQELHSIFNEFKSDDTDIQFEFINFPSVCRWSNEGYIKVSGLSYSKLCEKYNVAKLEYIDLLNTYFKESNY